jgi:basic amino acid/polyamine antiporter, APA family
MHSVAPSDAAAPQGSERQEFVRALTLTDATMLVAGSMIGSGIFIVSADIGRTVGSPFWLLVVWLLTAVITVLGALAYGELAAMFPDAGGQYIFLRESLGPLPGFLYGWTLFLVIQTGTIAAVAVAVGKFLGVLLPAIGPARYGTFPHADICLAVLGCRTPDDAMQLGLSPQRVVAIATVWILTWVNLRGVREGKLVQTSVTAVKTAALALLVIIGLTVGRHAEAIAANFGPGHFVGVTALAPAFVLAFGAALVGSLFSADAWNNVTFAAAEVQNPRRNLPLALLFGTGGVTLLYVLANVAYLCMLPFAGDPHGATVWARGIQYATEDRVGTAAMETIFGGAGAVVMAVAILISSFGCVNGLVLAGARVLYAMARDGLFFQRTGVLTARQVPGAALIVQAIWTSLLCLSGTYGQLLNYVIFAVLVFYVLTTIGLFVLRRTKPDADRPYHAVGYPVLPGLYILLAASVSIVLLVAEKTRAQSVAGLVLVLIGVPVFYAWRAFGRGDRTASPHAAR